MIRSLLAYGLVTQVISIATMARPIVCVSEAALVLQLSETRIFALTIAGVE